MIDTSTHAKSDTRQLRLTEELQSLRKGAGLSTWKLDKSGLIRNAIAAKLRIDESDLTAVRMYEFLVLELETLGDSVEARATRNAFGLDLDTPILKLSDRRGHYAMQLGRHPDTIEVYENRGIAELVQKLLREDQPVSPAISSASATASADVAKQMISQGLDAVYGLGNRSLEMLRNFEGGRQPFLDTNVELRLRPSDRGSDWFAYCLRYVFTSRLHTFRVGVTTRSHDTEILLASGLVDDVMQLNHSQDLHGDAVKLMDKTSFALLDDRDGSRRRLPFQQIAGSEYSQYSEQLWQLPNNSFEIYTVEIPQTVHADHDARYEFIQRCELSAKDPYAFWYAPCLMYLNNLIIDTSEFQPQSNTRFIIQPFLGSLIPGTLDATERSLTIAARGWIMQGNGLVILWTDK